MVSGKTYLSLQVYPGVKQILSILILLVLAEFTSGYVYASNNAFRYLQPKDGLIDGEINSIVQDQEGVMWFATWSGLVSYDGYNFTNYRPELGNPNSLEEKKVRELFIDSENDLWIVTSRGISIFLRDSKSFRKYRFDGASLASGVGIESISEINKTLIIHTGNKMYMLPLREKDVEGYNFKSLKIYESGRQITDSWDQAYTIQDTLYLVSNTTFSGSPVIYSAILKNDRYHSFLVANKLLKIDTGVNYLEYVKKNNTIYIGTENGIKIYSLTKTQLLNTTYFPGLNIQKIIYTSDNKLYCSTLIPELRYIDLHTGKTRKYKANPNQNGTLLNSIIHCLYEDFSGNLWIGHQGQGISILNLHQKEFHSYRQDPFNPNTLTANKVMCFESTAKEVFIGLRTGGLNITSKVRDPNSNPVFNPVKLKENNTIVPFNEGIWDIEKESDDRFWVGSDAGLFELTREGGEWYLKHFSKEAIFNKAIRKVYSDKNHNLWCAVFEQGLIFIPNPEENRTGSYFQYKTDASDSMTLSDNTVLTLDVDQEGRFWVGTVNGLNLLKTPYHNLDLSGKIKPDLKFKRFVAFRKDSNYLNNNEINCFYENYNGNIWIGTQGGGINILNPETGMFSHLTTADGLPGNDVLGILPDGSGNLWFSTTAGIATIDPHQPTSQIKYFTVSDGIQGDIFMVNSYYRSSDGEIFFGGDNGFTRFYPEDIRNDTIKPRIIFTNIKFGNKIIHVGDTLQGHQILSRDINETQKIVLSYRHKTFSIGVAALHYQCPEENRITYKLEGYDKKWHTIPAIYRNIYYSNLPPGSYILKTRAISSDSVVSEEAKVLNIEVMKPWYLTWYMLMLFILFAISLISGLLYIIVNHQKLIYEKRTHQLAIENNENKMQFLTNIAHGLKTPLSLVTAPVADLVQNYKDIKPEWKDHLLLIQRNSNYLLQLINQIIDFRKLNAGKLILYIQKSDIVKLIREVLLNFKSFEKSKEVIITTDIPYEFLTVYVDPQKIEEVLYNLLSNAFKHTPKGKNINISLKINNKPVAVKSNQELIITVFNEGKTLQENDKKKIFERFYKVDENIEGTGIGLSFSGSLVDLHKGKLEAETIADKGMAFNIYLPFTSTEEEIFNTPVEIENENTSTDDNTTYYDSSANVILSAASSKEGTIVLVEDNEELARFMKQVLSRNYHCEVAENGEEGLLLAKKLIPDIVISDIIMPEKDGYQLCKEIKTDMKTCHIPVILLTAKSGQDQIVAGYQTGADAYVTKPFDLEIISSQISRLIKNRELIRRKYHDQNFMVEMSSSDLSKDDEFLMNFRHNLEKNITDPAYNVKSLASSLHVSSTQLYRKIKAITGHSPVEFIRIIKLQKAYELLLKRDNSVKEICYMSGFNNISYFIKCFRGQFGITPANLKEKGTIRHEKTR